LSPQQIHVRQALQEVLRKCLPWHWQRAWELKAELYTISFEVFLFILFYDFIYWNLKTREGIIDGVEGNHRPERER